MPRKKAAPKTGASSWSASKQARPAPLGSLPLPRARYRRGGACPLPPPSSDPIPSGSRHSGRVFEERCLSSLNLVDPADEVHGSGVEKVLENRTFLAEVPHRIADVLLGDSVGIGLVPGGIGLGDRGGGSTNDACEDSRQVAELDAVDRASHGAAASMAEDDDKLGACNLGGELERAQDIRVDDVSSHAQAEGVADRQIEDKLDGYAGVHAGDDGPEGILPRRGRANLRRQVAGGRLAGRET